MILFMIKKDENLIIFRIIGHAYYELFKSNEENFHFSNFWRQNFSNHNTKIIVSPSKLFRRELIAKSSEVF